MKYWRDQGAPLEKLLMGFATYGRTFRTSSATNGVGAAASGAASAGPYTREAGFWSSYEVSEGSTGEHTDVEITRLIRDIFQTETSQIMSIFFHFIRFVLSCKEPVSTGSMSKWCHTPRKETSGSGLITRRALKSR